MLQIKWGSRNNFPYYCIKFMLQLLIRFILFKTFCDPSLEPSCKDGSNDQSQNVLFRSVLGLAEREQGSRSPKFGAEIRPHSQSQKVCFFPNSR